MQNFKKGFSLVEVIIVMAIVGILAAITVVAIKPKELLANGRNTRRVKDIEALNSALGQWLSREGAVITTPYDALGLTTGDIKALNPIDGSIIDEGVDATTVSELALPAYLGIIPKDPDGSTEYRIGVNDINSPTHVLVCTDRIEFTETYPESNYPNHIFCLAN